MQETNAKLISAGWMCVGFWIVVVELLTSQTSPAKSHLKNEPGAAKLASSAAGDRAFIVVGLPGDAEHETRFRELARTYHDWLTGPLGFPEDWRARAFRREGRAGAESEPCHKRGDRAASDRDPWRLSRLRAGCGFSFWGTPTCATDISICT